MFGNLAKVLSRMGFGLVLLGFSAFSQAETNSVTFPNLDELTHYTTVNRGVTKEHMLTSDAALKAVQAGQPVPEGTHVVLVDYQSGELYRYLVAQKLGAKSEDWQYQWFWPNKTIKADEDTSQCASCHQTQQAEQNMFTYSAALEFKK